MANADRLPLALVLSVAAQRATTRKQLRYVAAYQAKLAALESAYRAPSAAQWSLRFDSLPSHTQAIETWDYKGVEGMTPHNTQTHRF